MDRFDGALPIEVAYRLLTDTKLRRGGARPPYLTAEDDGRLFSLPLARPRQRRGVDKWAQGAELQLRKVDGAAYNENRQTVYCFDKD